MTASPIRIVFALFPGVTQLDFTGPHQVLSRLPGAEVILASRAGGAIETDGITFAGLRRLGDVERCDIICVPGGFGVTDNAIADEEFLRELRRLADGARYARCAPGRWRSAPRVCCAASAPPAIGAWRELLTHWRDPGSRARLRDGNVVTGGGVTAGIDFALTLVAEIAGTETAQAIQLGIEYAPAPPFEAGRPEIAPPEVLARATARYAAGAVQRRAAVEAAAERMRAAGF